MLKYSTKARLENSSKGLNLVAALFLKDKWYLISQSLALPGYVDPERQHLLLHSRACYQKALEQELKDTQPVGIVGTRTITSYSWPMVALVGGVVLLTKKNKASSGLRWILFRIKK